MKKKCTACGGTRLTKVDGLVYEGYYSDGNAQLRGESYVCLECGHIEIYSQELLKIGKEQEKEQQRIQKLYDELDEELHQKEAQMKESESNALELKKAIEELEKKTADEDISFKEHKKAEEELNEAKNKLELEKSKIRNCKYFIDKQYPEIKNRIQEKGHR